MTCTMQIIFIALFELHHILIYRKKRTECTHRQSVSYKSLKVKLPRALEYK